MAEITSIYGNKFVDEKARQDITESEEQIQQNTNDISDLKDDLTAAQVELAKKANTDGYYEDMTVGDAEQLVASQYVEDSVPYNFRPTVGDGDRAYLDAVVGGTVCVNQLAPILSSEKWAGNSQFGTCVFDGNKATYTITQKSGSQSIYISNVKGGIPLIKDHKYVVEFDATVSQSTSSLSVNVMDTQWVSFPSVQANTKQHCAKVFNSANATGGNAYFGIYPSTGAGIDVGGTFVFENVVVSDLTIDFGTTIADYVYGLETATAGAGVAWLKEYFPKIFNAGYIPYNTGNLVSVSGVSEKRNTGFNQWDEEYVNGFFNDSGVYTARADIVGSKNAIGVLPNTVYCFKGKASAFVTYWRSEVSIDNAPTEEFISRVQMNADVSTFTTPADCHYIFFNMPTAYGATYNHDICINLSDPARNGEYEPYDEHTYPLDSSLTIRGIPKLKDGKLYFDGDRYLPSGQVNRRYGIVDLGTLTWNYDSSSSQRWQTTTISSVIKNYSTRSANIVSDKWVADTSAVGGENGKMFTISGYIFCYSTDGVNKPTGTLLFELATPTTETAEPYQQIQIIDPDGTEEFVSTSIVPVGHETRYVPNLRAKLEKSPDSPSSDGVYIVQRSNGVNTYVPLASSATIQDIINRLTALEGA